MTQNNKQSPAPVGSPPVAATAVVFRPRMALWAGAASMAVVSFLIVIKIAAYAYSGSAGLLASLVDSLMDATVSVISFLAIRESLKPADQDHRYGHGKVEGLAALMQAAFIAGSAVFLMLDAIHRLASPPEIKGLGVGVVVMGVSTVLSMVLVSFQKFVMRQAPSLAVEADSAHYASDILINGGIMLALLAQLWGAPAWVDTLCAIAVALWLFRLVWRVGRGGVDMLLDRELSQDTRDAIKNIVLADARVLGLHDLRTRMVGMNMHISFDMDVNQSLTLMQAHDIAHDVEGALLVVFPNAEIMIHLDPLGSPLDRRHSVAGVHV